MIGRPFFELLNCANEQESKQKRTHNLMYLMSFDICGSALIIDGSASSYAALRNLEGTLWYVLGNTMPCRW